MSNVTSIMQAQSGSLSGLDPETTKALATGDCSRLNEAQKSTYFVMRCEAAGLDPRAAPFAFMRLNGKEVLYATRAASDQLAAKHGVRMTIVSQVTEEGIRVVTVRAEAKDGRVTEEIGALPVKGLTGEALSNALMKCLTKAKRRAILSLCGLGMLDETEVDSIPQAQTVPVEEPKPAPAVEVLPPAPKPKPSVPPPHVASLWSKVKKAHPSSAAAVLKEAAEKLALTKPTAEWSVTDCLDVEAVIFAAEDVPL